MTNKILIANPGSASKKYAFYDGGKEVLAAHFETLDGGFRVSYKHGKEEDKNAIDAEKYRESIASLVQKIIELNFISSAEEINKIGVRIVAPGKYFLEPRIVDETFLAEMEKAQRMAPLHVPPELVEIKELMKIFPKAEIAGVSDSTFFKDRVEESFYYGIPADDAEKFGIYRFGYHGISAGFVSKKMKEMAGEIPKRMVLCHLGSGISVIAIKDGKGFDSSMGFTPLEGVMMATRSGNIDAGAVTYLEGELGFGPEEIEKYLNNKSGLLGLSGKSGDMRELLELEKNGDENAKNAIDVFVYKIKKEIGAMIAAMGGIDALVFSATMGERSNIVREKICSGLEGLGIVLDKKNNDEIVEGAVKDGFINREDSAVKIAVVRTDEMKEIFEQIV